MNSNLKLAAALATGAVIGTVVYLYQPSEFTVWIHGSENVEHDVLMSDKINSNTELGMYCTDDAADLLAARPGDVAISARADSYTCRYVSPMLDIIPVIGWSNAPEFVGDWPVSGAISITNGAAWGQAIRYFVGAPNLGDSMAIMANYVIQINQARTEAKMSVLGTDGIIRILDESSPGANVSDGKYYGKLIDIVSAVRLATAATSTAFAAVSPSIDILLDMQNY